MVYRNVSFARPAGGSVGSDRRRCGGSAPHRRTRARPGQRFAGWASLAVAAALCGCAQYRPAPLADRPDLIAQLPHVTIHPATPSLPGVNTQPFNPSKGLGVNEVAMLAVLNNPDLKAYRTRAGVAHAQLFAAGLFPDPSLNLAGALPTLGPPPLMTALSAALSYALKPLVTRGNSLAAARQHVRAVDLDVVWQEWQVAQQARLYFVRVWYDRRERALLQRYRALYAAAYRRSQRALRQGNTTLDVTGTDLVGLLDADTRLNTLNQKLNKVRHQLRAQLGVAPTLKLPLTDRPADVHVPVPDDAFIRKAMALMPKRRPDLLALKAGYESQEAKLREAVLAQFPALDIGVNHGRDTSGVYTWGGDITIGLPLFNRNRGAIAVQRATRAQLRAEYQARLDSDYGMADRLRVQAHEITDQLHRVRTELPRIERIAAAGAEAFAAHNLPAATYLTLQTGALNKQIEAITLERSLDETAIALDTVLGEPIGKRQAHPQRSGS